MSAASSSLAQIARQVLSPLEAPASFVHSQLLGPATPPSDGGPEAPMPGVDGEDVDEWVAIDAAVARRIIDAGAGAGTGARVVLRWPALSLHEAPQLRGLALEAVVAGATVLELDASVRALAVAIARGTSIRAALASGDTGIDCYRAAAATRCQLGTAVPIRARWDVPLDVKGAALALTFGADEIAGPMAPPQQRYKLAQVGGPAEDGGRPSPSFVESLIQAAGRLPARRR